MKIQNRFLILILACFFISGCEYRYRYVCHNPDNWEKDICKKPRCEISRECPEHIFKNELKTNFSAPSCCVSCKEK